MGCPVEKVSTLNKVNGAYLDSMDRRGTRSCKLEHESPVMHVQRIKSRAAKVSLHFLTSTPRDSPWSFCGHYYLGYSPPRRCGRGLGSDVQ